jgi:G6PDH family F420-dependent oxidoreductase
MTGYGYTLMTEQSGPRELVRYAAAAERAGFDFEMCRDHFFPWLESMGHSPYAWAVLGAATQVTEQVELMTYVTCPTMRYHPAVVAQKSATMALLSRDRFTLGLGSGENLNEHVIGEGWPAVGARQDMLEEAVEVIRLLHDAGTVTWDGDYFRLDQARVWDLPDTPVPIAIAVSGTASVRRFAPLADHLVAVQPESSLVSQWDEVRRGAELPASRKIGQVPICWGRDKAAAVTRAHELFRWFGGGWNVNADLPTHQGFEGASAFVREQDVADSIACGPDLDELAASVQPFVDAGFTDIAVVQIGDESQDEFLDTVAEPLLRKLRQLGASH